MTPEKEQSKSARDRALELISGRQEQIEAITSDSSLTVVSAGAGTGKTHTLAQRFAWLLASDAACSVEEILVLTFTEKAAREMQVRIKDTVSGWHSKSPRELAHLKDALLRMSEANISTIHSFAMKVIKELALVLDIAPTSRVVPEARENLWWNEFATALDFLSKERLLSLLDKEWRARVDRLFDEKDFVEIIEAYSPEVLAQASKNAAEVLGSVGKTPEYLWDWPAENLINDIKQSMGWYQYVWDLWMGDVFPNLEDVLTPKDLEKSRKTKRTSGKPGFVEVLWELNSEFSDTEYSEENAKRFARRLIQDILSNLPGSSKAKDKIEEAIETKLKDWRDRAKIDLAMRTEPSEEEERVSALLNQITAVGWQCWNSLRKEECLLSMNDLISFAAEAISKSPEYGRKFRHILIDEFQDTDHTQEKMLSSLWKAGGGTLFVVGDLKQSIYRFRHADLGIFQRYIEEAKSTENSSGKYITLDRSYRTKGALLSRFNDIFSTLWESGLEPGTPMRYEPLQVPDDAEWWQERNVEKTPPSFDMLLSVEGKYLEEDGQETEDKEGISDVRLRLFGEVAARIADMHAKKHSVWDKSPSGFAHREITWKDFALLVPTRSVYPEIERVFETLGIPYVLCTSKNYFSRGDVADLVNFIFLLTDTTNPFYLVNWLSSPLSGVDYERAALFVSQVRGAENGASIVEIVEREVPETWRGLKRLEVIARLKGTSAVMFELMKKPFFLASYDARQRKNVIANMARMHSIAEEFEMSQGHSIQEFADYLRIVGLKERQQEEPEVTDEDYDAVRVMTIHAAKGLEFPVTIVFCDKGTAGSAKGGIAVSVRYGVVTSKIPKFMGEATGRKTTRYFWFREYEETKNKAEQERLWYVALTRARDKLILCATAKKDEDEETIAADGFAEHVLSSVDDTPSLFCPKTIPSEIIMPKAGVKSQNKESIVQLELPEVSPAKLAKISATAYSMIAWCPNAYRIAYRQGRNLKWTVKSGESDSGADFGSLAHWVLSQWDFEIATIEKWLPADNNAAKIVERNVPPSLRSEFRERGVRDSLRKLLSAYADTEESEALRLLISAKEGKDSGPFREIPFRVLDDSLLMVGAIDIMWETPAVLQIRDWKTTAEEFAPDEYYEEQLSFYAYAVRKYREQIGLPDVPVEIGINYLRPSNLRQKTKLLTDEGFKKIEKKIHGAAETALMGEFLKRKDRCDKCPWKGDCD